MRARHLKRFGLAALAGPPLAAMAGAVPSAAQYGPYPSAPSAPTHHPAGGKSKAKHKKKHKSSGPTVSIAGKSASKYRFSPQKVTISSGGTVKWSWQSNAPHNVTFSSLGKHSATGSSGNFQLKFAKSGTFSYHCTIHNFTGTVVVK
ncbi:MAG TPA: plastocyanin/azurin family copper-binding protein [Solirubrobacteraceae bacterium]|jgi:plastocyanin|nr:plastocyanin/azurin family copper-binding protein [Solirubrobacteraceae bacterium]